MSTTSDDITIGAIMRETGLSRSAVNHHLSTGAIRYRLASDRTRLVRRADFEAWERAWRPNRRKGRARDDDRG